ncbi:hypothetical protein [Pedobacter sp. V48]|uniref:hypothetical protein n=1 Tax=Pedobacter sp. V48 TaxID=509635 RepID=UPI0003E4B35D|nr:hypothetical protein [Pedobacter sp. V48]ETZ22788.1 hypothetical protein N824_21085 [Pedobacter sp. V48]
MERRQPFCIALGQNLIVAIFNDELEELQDYAMDAGDALWYIMGTDAWLELQTKDTKSALVARSYDKTYFTCFVDDEIVEKIKRFEEGGIIVLSSNEELRQEDLLNDLEEDSSLDDIGYWIEDKSEKKGMDIGGLIFCYYSIEARKRLHGNDYID